MNRTLVWLVLAISLSTGCEPSAAADGPDTDAEAQAAAAVSDAPAPPPVVRVPAQERRSAVDYPESLLRDLRLRRWESAAEALLAIPIDSVPGDRKSDHAFVTAWALVHADKPKEAAPFLELAAASKVVPPGYLALVQGEVALDADAPLEALKYLEKVPEDAPIWPRAAVVRAETLRELSRTQEAFAIYEALIERPDPADGNPEALLALAARAGVGSPKAYGYARRVWAQYPRTDHSVAAYEMLKEYEGPEYAPTWQEVGQRAERLMYAGHTQAAINETTPHLSSVEGKSEDACRFLFARGRSFYKRNQLSNSIGALDGLGERCVGVEEVYGPAALYLTGKAHFRKGQHRTSAAVYSKLPDLYPEHSYADDGLMLAGISLLEAEDIPAAQAMWRRALDDFPEGDTAPESTWRLAWSLYLEGKTDEARVIAKRLSELPLGNDPVHVAAGSYWHARWALYPDVENPRAANEAGRAEAVAGWKALCETLPHNFYSILAWSRLKEEAPEVAAALAKRPAGHSTGDLTVPWAVRVAFYEDARIQRGAALARLGLANEALSEWALAEVSPETGDEEAWITELRIASGDWLEAHDDMRHWLASHPPGTLGEQEPQVIRVGYPDRYWTEVSKAAEGYRYEPRLFHALSREESNFNRTITSHAGARGLSQLMPATAKQVAGWMNITLTSGSLDDPMTNARIGSRYLDVLHKQHDGSPYQSLAAYNAGAGRVRQWHTRYGDVPTDEWVEHVPFRETRGYIKRVMGTWQTYRYQFDVSEPAFYDLSTFNHHAYQSDAVEAAE